MTNGMGIWRDLRCKNFAPHVAYGSVTSRLCTNFYRTCGAKMNDGEGLFDTGQRDAFHYRVEGLLLRSAEVR